ncbi:MAG: ABC transporter ATP-binding protein [Burkholderiales bacterium]|nr:ABC transporter ATP-binding protein [Burkholderiales bacterium]
MNTGQPTGGPGGQAAATAPVLDIRDLHIDAGGRRVVEGVSFSVAPGEFLSLVGESGSGKSLTGRAVLRLLPPGVQQAGGTIHVQGRDLMRASPAQMRALRGPVLGMIFQEPMSSLNPALTIGAQMSEALRLHQRLSHEAARSRCLAMLERVGISGGERCLRAYPHEYSGGMRQRIMIASVMLLAPKLLIADEPTTALDTLIQREVLYLMTELAREQGTAVVLITHNLGLVARYTQHAVVMQQGRVVETGAARELLRCPREAYTRALVDALPRRTAEPIVAAQGAPVIAVEHLSVSFRARQGWFKPTQMIKAVDDVSLAVHAGETVALVGGSGSGKTTLGRAMLRLVPASAGAIRFDGQDVRQAQGAALQPLRLACQLVFQDPYSSLDPRMRVAAIVAEPLRLLPGMSPDARRERVEQVLAEVGLAQFGERFPHQLSGGQRQRVAIARAIVRRPRFVVADEPVSALDMTIQKQILALFKALQRQHGFACLFVSHDLAAVEQMADRVVVMQQGRIVEQGSRDLVFDAPLHPYTKALLAAAPEREVASLGEAG